MRNFVPTALACAFLMGATPSASAEQFNVKVPEYTQLQLPEINTVREAEPGQSMISTLRRAEIPAIVLANSVTHSGSKHMASYSVTIPAGVLPLQASNAAGEFFSMEKPLSIHWSGILGGDYPVRAGIFIPFDSTGTKVFYGNVNGLGLTANEAHPDVKYERTTVEKFDASAFKRELVYGGVSQNTISILYREFLNDMARPAFSQDLKFDLSQGDEIAYKGARFKVVKANNVGLSFIVLRPLN